MRLFASRAPRHAVSRGASPGKGLTALAASVAVGAALVIAPIVGVLGASPAQASPPISAVGSTATSAGVSLTTLNDNPQQLGDVIVVVSEQDNNGEIVNSISGGGVTTWSNAVRYVGIGEPRGYEIWYGVVTSLGSNTITFNLSAQPSGMTAEYEAQEFTAGLGAGAVWTFDKAGHFEVNPASTTLMYPSLTPAGPGELYFGFDDMPSTPAAGSTTGFTYFTTADSNQVAFNPSVGPGAVQPTSTQGASHLSSSVAVLLAVQPAPGVTSVSPAGGPIAGGTTVTVTGANFTGATAVNFGAIPGTSLVVNGGGTSLTVTSPAKSAGALDVTVVTPEGTSAISAADTFTYFGVPTVTGVAPHTGTTTGGNSVTVTGTNLAGATAVSFGANPGPGVVVNGAGTSLTVTSPAGAKGTVDVTVATPGGVSAISAADHFTYQSAGYWMVGADGSVFSFGSAPFEGSLPGLGVHVSNIVAIVPTGDSKGYWMIGSDGGVFAFGDAGFVGSLPGLHVHVTNIVGAVPTSTGKGYWMVGTDGGVFAFGDAGFVGSLPGLNVHVSNVVAVVPDSTGKGYWMIGSDGGVFAFGDAGFVGSLPGLHVHVTNIVGAVPTSTGKGYWMIGADGGVFAFGDASFVGSLPGINVHVANVVGVVATSSGQGYWMVGSDGGVFAFGDAGFVGSIPGLGIHVSNIVAFARQ